MFIQISTEEDEMEDSRLQSIIERANHLVDRHSGTLRPDVPTTCPALEPDQELIARALASLRLAVIPMTTHDLSLSKLIELAAETESASTAGK